jgi:hypothetical protein
MGLDSPDRSQKIDKAIDEGLELKRNSPYDFYILCLNYKDMADGETAFGLRTVFPDWEDSDFQEVLDAIGGDETLNEQSQPGSPRFYDVILERFKKRTKDSSFYQSMFELVQMASGGNPFFLRRYYPGWTNDDFKRLLLDLEQEAALDFRE